MIYIEFAIELIMIELYMNKMLGNTQFMCDKIKTKLFYRSILVNIERS